MGHDDDNHTIDFQRAFAGHGRNRKNQSSYRRKRKNRELAAIKASLRLEERMRSRKQMSRASPPAADASPDRHMLKATRELLWDYSTITIEQLRRKLHHLGYEADPLTINSIRKEFMTIIRIGEERGYLKSSD